MKNQKLLLLVIVLVLIAGTAGALTWLRANQKLGRPGIQATAIPGSVMMQIDLPANVPGFTSTNMPEPQTVIDYLPKDTSYAGRLYTATNGLQINSTLILMGADRTSIHKPEYCLPGQGWSINKKAVVSIPVSAAQTNQLHVARWVVGNAYQTPDGQKHAVSGLYVFWFVADGEQTPDNYERMWWLGRDLLQTGVLQRWAYVAYFAMCEPGQEDATFEQMQDLITHSVPEIHAGPAGQGAVKN